MKDACLVVSPHPDDETLGAGIWMDRHRSCDITVLHLTDGSPRELSDARAAGFSTQKSYGAARRRELREALSLIGLKHHNLRSFSYVDKELYLHLPDLVARMAELLSKLRPSLVLSPAYEGGHPDHDSAALAVAAARAQASIPFQHREFRLYHAGPDGRMVTSDFLPHPGCEVEVMRLSAEEQEKKRRMLTLFRSQKHMLDQFGVLDEQFRDAPTYDFSRAPHEGKLLYEHWGWNVLGAEWRQRALCALPCSDARAIEL